MRLRSTAYACGVMLSLAFTTTASADSAVSLYGRAHLSADFIQSGDAEKSSVSKVASNTSRIGVRGFRDMPGNLKGFFQIEGTVFLDNGNGAINNRESFVGLEGGFGRARMGYMLAPYDELHFGIWAAQMNYLSGIGSSGNLWANTNPFQGVASLDIRQANVIRYDTPVVNGFQAALQVGLDQTISNAGVIDNNETKNGRRLTSMKVTYNKGPLRVGVAHQTHDGRRGQNLKDTGNEIAVGYDFGQGLYVGGIAEALSYEVSGGNLKRNFAGVVARKSFGQHGVEGFVGKAFDGKGPANSAIGLANGSGIQQRAGDGTGATQMTFTYNYAFDKQTNVYALYTRVNNGNRANFTLSGGPSTSVGGAQSGISIGVKYDF